MNSYFQNPFLNVTSRNYKRMLIMARDHRDKMSYYSSIEADLLPIFESLDLCFGQFESALRDITYAEGKYMGYTDMAERLFEELRSEKIKQWDIAIQAQHLEGTPAYIMLLPNRRAPFQKGAYELRISNIKTLLLNLEYFPALSAVQKDIEAFCKAIDETRTQQQLVEAQVKQKRLRIAHARKELAREMYRVMGYLMYKHHDNPKELSRYYEMKYLRAPKRKANKELALFEIKSNSVLTLFDGGLHADSYITIQNLSPYPLVVFTSATPKHEYAQGMRIESKETYSFYAQDHNDGTGFSWLMVKNESAKALVFKAGVA